MNTDKRRYTIIAIFLSISIIFIVRLFMMQVVNEEWKIRAIRNTVRSKIIFPNRGLIYDRNGQIMVANQATYDIVVVPSHLEAFDTLAFCDLLQISKEELLASFKTAKKGLRYYQESTIEKQIAPEAYALIAEQLYHFPGFDGKPRTLRSYPHNAGALALGDIGEVWAKEMDADPYYTMYDYTGKAGIEKAYEKLLRGKRGSMHVYRDKLGVEKDLVKSQLDSNAIGGTNLYCTLDLELQKYGERLMVNKKGCVVAIEPATGEILALVSAPSFDPNLLVGRKRSENYSVLLKDSLRPLVNRAVQGSYRPGSIFKMVQSLIALQGKTITPATRIWCNRSIIGCHGAHSFDDLGGAIQHSCNPYFREVMKRMVEAGKHKSRFEDAHVGLDIWQAEIKKFGFGTDLGTDVPGMNSGLVPNSAYYDEIYGVKRWAYSTIYSLSIGEGELLISPLQMANLSAIIANRGHYYSPHLIKVVEGQGKPAEFNVRNETGVDAEYFRTVVEAMHTVVDKAGGTARRARITGIEVCGKTGTVQNDHLNLPDHSVFIAFAPKENPKIAIAVYVEYAGFGGQWAAPIASLMMEKYLTDSISNPKKEERIINQKFLDY